MITVIASKNGESNGQLAPVLVLEDNEIDRYVLQKELGSRVANPLHMTPDSRVVMEYLEGHGPYSDRQKFPFPVMLIADLRVWGHSGLEVLAWCRYDQRREVRQLPVVLLTAHADEEIRSHARKFGVNAFLTKPLDIHAFGSLLETLPSLRVSRNDGAWMIETAEVSA